MIKRLAVAAVAVIGICSAVPASAEQVGVGVGVGPVGAGVTIGSGRSDYDRDRVHERTIIREREPRRDETVIIKKRDRDYDRDMTARSLSSATDLINSVSERPPSRRPFVFVITSTE